MDGEMSSPTPYHLLFVCSGNLCRSPMAESMARTYSENRGWRVEVRSAGTLGIVGRPAEPLAIKVMGEIGQDISGHRSQGIDEALVAWADHILVMELAHASELRRRFAEAEDKVLLLGNFGGSFEIADPMGGWRWRFRAVRDTLRTCVESFLDQLPPRPSGA